MYSHNGKNPANKLIVLFSVSSGLANGAIVVVPVNDFETTIGTDDFLISQTLRGLRKSFGSIPGSDGQVTANRVSLFGGNQYFNVRTSPLLLGVVEGARANYVDNLQQVEGATGGINFSTYDTNQDGVADTLFMLYFSPLNGNTDDFIFAYATETGVSAIDLNEARMALLATIPEPSSCYLLGAGFLSFLAFRGRK